MTEGNTERKRLMIGYMPIQIICLGWFVFLVCYQTWFLHQTTSVGERLFVSEKKLVRINGKCA